MEPDSVLNLLDSFWFYGRQTSETQIKTSISSISEPRHLIKQLTVNTKSKIEQLPIEKSRTCVSTEIYSPDSVLSRPHLETILSEDEISLEIPRTPKPINKSLIRKKNRSLNKSLSQLESEELKGFMDLGFVFSEEDKRDTDLLEIIPGLQKLGRVGCSEGEGEKEENIREFSAGAGSGERERVRPYLAEAWGVMEMRKRKIGDRPLMNWRVPAGAVVDEIYMKDNLKWWAHTVASAVR